MIYIKKPLDAARTYISRCDLEGELVVDATAGNGHDSVFLAQRVGEKGRVIAFDIQQAALLSTKNRLIENNLDQRVSLVLSGHEHAKKHVKDDIAAAMFNLGYLPGGNHSITTCAETTIKALDVLIKKLKPGGIITLISYTGHSGGVREKNEVLAYCSKLSQTQYTVLNYEMINQINDPPSLVVMERHKYLGFIKESRD